MVDHFGNEREIDAAWSALECQMNCAHALKTRAFAGEPMQPRKVDNISGSSSKNAPWPLSVSISTKLTLAAAALSAWTIWRLPDVGNSQSDVKETTQKRVAVSLNALASTPPKSAARSK